MEFPANDPPPPYPLLSFCLDSLHLRLDSLDLYEFEFRLRTYPLFLSQSARHTSRLVRRLQVECPVLR